MAPREKKIKTTSLNQYDAKQQSGPNLLDLPNEMILKIMTYLTCDQVAQLRSLCRRLDYLCSMELYKQFKLACMIVSKCFIKIRSSLLEFDECRIEVDDGSELRRFILLYKLDDILFKMFSHLRCLTKTIGYYVEEKGQVFFPGKIIDTIYRTLYTLIKPMKDGSLYAKIPEYLENHDYDISHLDKLVSMAINHFNVFMKGKLLNFRSSTINQMKKYL